VIHHHYKPKTPFKAKTPARIATPGFPEGSTPYIKEQARLQGLPLTDQQAREQREDLKRYMEAKR